MEKNVNEAKRLYLEQYGGTLVANTYLRVALFLVSLGLLGALLLAFLVFSWAKNQKPMVVRIDPTGRASVADYTGKPEPPELRYFLARFVQLHYSRLIASVERNFAESLFFMDQRLSTAVMEEERKAHAIAIFLKETGDEVDVDIKNIALQDIRSSPMKATVDFEKVFFTRGDRREVRRERYAGYFEFVVQEKVPNNFILVNPLGLTVTYFRADAAFK
jgi:type IV secretory pathway component VirB8